MAQFHKKASCIIMLTCCRLTPSISMLSTMDPLEISQLDSANMDWLLHFPEVPKQPRCPLTFEPRKAEVRQQSASLMVPHAHTAAEKEREKERMPHEFTSSGGRGKKRIEEEFLVD